MSELTQHKLKEALSKSFSRNDNTAWSRRMDKMVKLVASIRPIEDEILELTAKRRPIMDEVEELRREMVDMCPHPYTHLVVLDEEKRLLQCKFCNKQMQVTANVD